MIKVRICFKDGGFYNKDVDHYNIRSDWIILEVDNQKELFNKDEVLSVRVTEPKNDVGIIPSSSSGWDSDPVTEARG